MLILSDDYAEEDLIGHNAYRDGLVEVIRSIDAKGSFTIGVYGQWGAGKTSILKSIKSVFDDQNQKNCKRVLTVWFNPWQFTSDEHLIIPFFHTMVAAFKTFTTEAEDSKYKKKLKKFLTKISHIPLALFYGLEPRLKFPLFEARISMGKIMDYQDKGVAAKDENKNSEFTNSLEKAVKKYESTYYCLSQILQDAVNEIDSKIVIFIDDLDRCLPEKALQLLEGLKVLLDLPNFVFVVGVAQEVIERGIRVRCSELFKTEYSKYLFDTEIQYLDKIIQFPFSLPAPNPLYLKQNILKKQLSKLKNAASYVELVYEVLGSNPRTLKRFLNAVSFALHLADQKMVEVPFHTELIIKISLIGYLFPALYRQLEKQPGLLVRLENIILRLGQKQSESGNDENGDGLIESFSDSIEKTGLPLVDPWLEEDKINILIPILRKRMSFQSNNKIEGMVFGKKETVIQYVRLLATSLQPEVTSKIQNQSQSKKPLMNEIQDRMVLIPPGKFIMGDEKTTKVEVTISKTLMIDKYPITQDLYQKVMNTNPSHFIGEDLPVENLSWFSAIEFCNELSRLAGLAEVYEVNGKEVVIHYDRIGYRLPTEAEWEYACRSGTTLDQYGELDEIAWFLKNSGKQTQGVRQKKPNSFGLYDMLGNVWEWCNDWYSKKFVSLPQTDPIGPNNTYQRVLRGGSWANFDKSIKASYRTGKDPLVRDNNKGFRIVLPQS